MSRLTLRLPETLHQQLIHLAESEGVSLNQYIVYALTRQVALAYTVQATPVEEINQQQQAFQGLLKELGQASSTEVKSALDKREIVQSEEELSPEIVARFQQHIHEASKA
jgi:predicted HicB family RNase H-like nuclease